MFVSYNGAPNELHSWRGLLVGEAISTCWICLSISGGRWGSIARIHQVFKRNASSHGLWKTDLCFAHAKDSRNLFGPAGIQPNVNILSGSNINTIWLDKINFNIFLARVAWKKFALRTWFTRCKSWKLWNWIKPASSNLYQLF